uniref:TBC1 domain family member 7 isoform X1 n=1 Tax=Myxine glutinosa TaxID=7769 RepID=UPI00358FC54C
MAEDSVRNFRSHYYEKVGFRGVEEKRSLEVLLKEEPLDLDKLCMFTQRFPIPALYRVMVWKVLLGILPSYQSCHGVVIQQRTEQYKDLKHAIELLRLASAKTPIPTVCLHMYRVEMGLTPLDSELEVHLHGMQETDENVLLVETFYMCNQIARSLIDDIIMSPICRHLEEPKDDEDDFLAIASTMSELAESELDAYWLSRCFVLQFNSKHADSLPHLPKSLEHYLALEELRLLQHLKVCGALVRLPYSRWFRRCFAGSLPNSSLERVWDKVISGSCKLLVFVALAILISFKMTIMKMNMGDGIVGFLENLPQENADVIAGRAIDLWQKHTGLAAFPLT